MLDVATRFIGLETENKQLRYDYEFEHSRVNIIADKLKVAEGALEEANASLATAEQRLEDERSSCEAYDEDIRKRLEVLNTSLLSTYLCLFLVFHLPAVSFPLT
jgi:chromosome segregation ATPase